MLGEASESDNDDEVNNKKKEIIFIYLNATSILNKIKNNVLY